MTPYNEIEKKKPLISITPLTSLAFVNVIVVHWSVIIVQLRWKVDYLRYPFSELIIKKNEGIFLEEIKTRTRNTSSHHEQK